MGQNLGTVRMAQHLTVPEDIVIGKEFFKEPCLWIIRFWHGVTLVELILSGLTLNKVIVCLLYKPLRFVWKSVKYRPDFENSCNSLILYLILISGLSQNAKQATMIVSYAGFQWDTPLFRVEIPPD
jgi:hypothetical protein